MRFPAHIRAYVVGGAVRDALLGLATQDRDHVVVGATPEEMTALGFQPVGKDFPVFLHPVTHEEYALARTERKTARGYKGFQVSSSPDVSLEDDLRRRDLTINAMALDEDGTLIDPYHGRTDLAQRCLRHVSPAFVEDPVRVLRVARFAARFAGFEVAPETRALMARMVTEGEVDALVPERVWQEIARGLMEHGPSRMIQVLRECGALARIVPELDRLFGVPQAPDHHPERDTGEHILLVLDWAAAQGHPLSVRWAALLHDLGKGVTPEREWPLHPGHEETGAGMAETVSERLRAPADCRDLAVMTAREHGVVHRVLDSWPLAVLPLLERCDAFRRPARFEAMLLACAADFHGRPGYAERPYPPPGALLAALSAARNVDAGSVARAAPPGRIAEHLQAARAKAIRLVSIAHDA